MSLSIKTLSKRYQDKWVLRDVSFDVQRGEVFGLFGPLGSGKTTLLDATAGRISTNGGSVAVDDRDVTNVSAASRGFHTMHVANGSVWSRLTNRRRAASGGEAQRQALDAAIARATGVLLLDDPFRSMDANSIGSSVEKIRNAARERNLSVIFASSDFNEILQLCDRLAVLAGGEIKQVGAPQEIYERPTSWIVAETTGKNNLFAARRLTSSKAEMPEFHTIDGGHRLFAERIERGLLGALNQNVTLGIRPEQISISFGASFPADNLLKATVTRVSFRGATTLIELDAGGLKLETLVLRLVGLNVGDECMVGLPPERIRIFRD
jgi:multiple sugar transport system ATP-binding protein